MNFLEILIFVAILWLLFAAGGYLYYRRKKCQ